MTIDSPYLPPDELTSELEKALEASVAVSRSRAQTSATPKPRAGEQTEGDVESRSIAGWGMRAAELEAECDALAEALEASINAGDSHYAHWDAQGTAGANCPACKARREVNSKARALLAKHGR